METSTAKSVMDKAKEEERWSGIDTPKTRRRIEDTLRKSGPETIIKIAEILGVEIAEQIPEEWEIILADLWDQLEKGSSEIWKWPDTVRTGVFKALPVGEIQNTILCVLPKRFNTYFLISVYDDNHWSRVSRDFFTHEAAEKYNEKGWYRIKVNHFNVIQMRLTIQNVLEEIQQQASHSGEKVPPLEPDEEAKVRQLKRILYPRYKLDRKPQIGLVL